jgi:hypothetical protein
MCIYNCIGVGTFNVFASSEVDRGFEPKTTICICCLRSKSKDWLDVNQDDVYPRTVVLVS